jgi:hypothetical protein
VAADQRTTRVADFAREGQGLERKPAAQPIPAAELPAAELRGIRGRPPIELRGVRGREADLPAVELRPAAAQLDLDLVRELPRLPIEADWKDRARLWGHAFHPMCSYLASFPAALAHAFIARYSRPGDVVLDPFCGRGTVPLQACVEGRLGVGNDLNPFAHVLTAAKVDPPTAGEAGARLARLRIDWSFEASGWEALGNGLALAADRALAKGGAATDGGGHAVPVRGFAVPGAGSGVSVLETYT